MIWEDLIKTALIGTDRTNLSEETLKELTTLGVDVTAHPAKIVMDAASFYTNMQKLARPISSWNAPLPTPCELEHKAICNPLSVQHLSMILNSNYHGEILNEFLQHVRFHQMILPAEQLPELLNRCKNNPTLWLLLKDVIAKKGYWLIQQNPDWQHLNHQVGEEHWETGTKELRINFLKKHRRQHPQKALELLQVNWEQEDFRSRLAFLQCLSIALSPSDEKFLEQCITDRKKEIRQEAVMLLVQIKNSRLTQKIFSKIKTIVSIKKRLLKKEKLDIVLPELEDPFFKENGIEAKNAKYSGGQKAALAGQLFALLPPENWEQFLAQNTKEVIETFARSEWSTLLLEASVEAAILHQNEAWMRGLLHFAIQQKDKERWQEFSFDPIFKHISDVVFNEVAMLFFQQQKILTDEADILTKLLQNKVRPWEDRLSLQFIQSLKEWITRSDNAWGGWHYKQVLAVAQYCIDPKLFKELTKDWPERARNWHNWIEPVERFLTILSFRRKMALAFSSKINHDEK